MNQPTRHLLLVVAVVVVCVLCCRLAVVNRPATPYPNSFPFNGPRDDFKNRDLHPVGMPGQYQAGMIVQGWADVTTFGHTGVDGSPYEGGLPCFETTPGAHPGYWVYFANAEWGTVAQFMEEADLEEARRTQGR